MPDQQVAPVDPASELRLLAEAVEKLSRYRDPERAVMAQDAIIKRLEALANHIDAGG